MTSALHIIRFCKELLRDHRRTVGRIDSRYTGIDRVADGDNMEADPSLDATGPVATSALNAYLRDELGFEADKIYEIMSMKVNERWNYEDFKNRYVDTSEMMRELMSRSPAPKCWLRMVITTWQHHISPPNTPSPTWDWMHPFGTTCVWSITRRDT